MAVKFRAGHKKAVLIFLGVVVLTLLIAAFTINGILAPIMARKIKKTVSKGSDSLYRINFSKIEVNVFTGSAELDSIQFIADTARARFAGQVVSGTARQLLISGASPLAYLFHKKLEIGQIILLDANLSYTMNKTSKAPPSGNKTLYQKISSALKCIAVQNIKLEHAQLSLADYTGSKASVEHLKEFSLDATDLLIDSVTQKDTSRTLFCRDIVTSIHDFSGLSDDGLYVYRLRSAHFSTRSEKLVLRGMLLQPLPVNTFFAKSRADRFSFELDSMMLDRFNYRSFMSDHSLKVKKMSAFKGSIGVFGNPNGKLQKTDRVITFPNYIIRTLQTHFAIDTMDISAFAVSYRELNQQSGKTGVLDFKNTKARFLHISNEASLLQSQPECTAQLSSLFMGQGKLSLSFVFNLSDKAYAYQYQGHLAPMPLAAINPVVMPLALVRIKKGQLNALDFSITGDQKKSSGSLRLLYNDLDVDLLNSDYHNKMLKTLLVNTLVISHNNPDHPGGRARFAKVVYLRPRNYPFFKTLWETLFSGIKPCAGIGYAVKPDAAKPLTKQEQKAKAKALKASIKAKKKAEKEFRKKLNK